MDNRHKQVAGYILGLLKKAPMNCEESERVSGAKQWLGLIATGQMEVTQVEQRETPKPELVPEARDPNIPPGLVSR